jgi:predicted membrane-bound dolichyl-phosphate-mannose-protein mannosyltransferase
VSGFLTEIEKDYEIFMLVALACIILFQLSYYVTGMHETLYAYYAMPTSPNASFAGFVQTVSATWRRSKLDEMGGDNENSANDIRGKPK